MVSLMAKFWDFRRLVVVDLQCGRSARWCWVLKSLELDSGKV